MSAPSTLQPHDVVASRRKRRRRHLAEIAATVLLSLGSVAISWSSYQAASWSGIQVTRYAQANEIRARAMREFTAAGLLQTVDIALFTSWVNAYAAGDERLQNFYRTRFRAEFRPAFARWLGSEPQRNPHGAPTPFTLPEYRIGRQVNAAALERAAQERLLTGQRANDYGTRYVLNSVVLATVLFFAGIAQQFQVSSVQLALLGIAALLLTAGIVGLGLLPMA